MSRTYGTSNEFRIQPNAEIGLFTKRSALVLLAILTGIMWAFEKKADIKGYKRIAGVDEAGRGPLAGPVVSAAVILPDHFPVTDITDSKKLTPKKRASIYNEIYEYPVAVGIGIVDPVEIDRINILQASLLSMFMAVEKLTPKPDFLLIDGIFPIPSHIHQEPVKKGDSLSVSIATASIIAKVTRDRIMERYHDEYPDFGFLKHKGYPTKKHKEMIARLGCCPIHRKKFKGVREHLIGKHLGSGNPC